MTDPRITDPRILFVIPYFGQWPFWMPFFLQSCRHNPSIDWLFFSDCGTPAGSDADPPENVRVIDTSFTDYCRLVSEKLDIHFAPPAPYKLCDLKPALGYVHEEHLHGYDYWAFGDIDVIYGNLRAYFTARRLAGKDLLATHARRVSGHLCLLRNTARIREAFMRMPRWRERLADPQHLALDEGAFSRLFMFHKNWPEPVRRLVGRFSPRYRRCEFVEAHSTYAARARDGAVRLAESWTWRNGTLENSDAPGVARPYLHFMFWKNDAWQGRQDLVQPPDLHRARAWRVSAAGWQAVL